MANLLLYYVRHGETDWNVEGRLQGQRDIPLNAVGRLQARRCGEILRDLLGREGADPAALDFVASPLGRARATMTIMRATLGLEADDYRLDDRLREISFGAWEGFTLPELRRCEPDRVAARERSKWSFAAPGGESYADVTNRMRGWYGSVTRDAVVVAHGGTARGLIALLGIAPPERAPLLDIDQGVVYLLAPGRMTRCA